MNYRLSNIVESFMNKIKKVKNQKDNDPFGRIRQGIKEDLDVVPFACRKLGNFIAKEFNGGISVTYSVAKDCKIEIGSNFFERFEKECKIEAPYSFNELKYFLSSVQGKADLLYTSSWLGEITIPKTWTELEDSFFRNYPHLSKVQFDGDIDKINGGCFADCKELKEIILPDSVTELGSACFYGCDNLEHATLPSRLEIIPDDCFGSCSKLDGIAIPDSVKVIGKDSFSMCFKLQNLRLPNSLVQIKGGAFSAIGKTDKVIFPASLRKIGSKAFNSHWEINGFVFNSKVNLSNTSIFGNYIDMNSEKIYLPKKYKVYYSDEKHFPKQFRKAVIYF